MMTVRNAPLTTAGRTFGSRLMVETGKDRTSAEIVSAVPASHTGIVNVSPRQIDFDDLRSRSIVMELGADACHVNTAIVLVKRPALMKEAFTLDALAGQAHMPVGNPSVSLIGNPA